MSGKLVSLIPEAESNEHHYPNLAEILGTMTTFNFDAR